jgi:hypothetical protein
VERGENGLLMCQWNIWDFNFSKGRAVESGLGLRRKKTGGTPRKKVPAKYLDNISERLTFGRRVTWA